MEIAYFAIQPYIRSFIRSLVFFSKSELALKYLWSESCSKQEMRITFIGLLVTWRTVRQLGFTKFTFEDMIEWATIFVF